jgi:hypothetical protein
LKEVFEFVRPDITLIDLKCEFLFNYSVTVFYLALFNSDVHTKIQNCQYYCKYKLIGKTMSPTNMLELQELVLENVSENNVLFEKELRKSFQWLGHEDLYILYHWAIGKFNEQCHNIINMVYSGFDFQNSQSINSFAQNLQA